MALAEVDRSTREDTLERLKGNFEVAIEKGKKDPIERAGDQLVTFACEENLDCLSMLQVIEIANGAIASPGKVSRSGGVHILEGMDTYLTHVGVCHKLLVPPDFESPEVIRRRFDLFEKTAERVSRLTTAIRKSKFQHQAAPNTPALKDFAHAVSIAFTSLDRSQDKPPPIPIVQIIVNGRAILDRDKAGFDSVIQTYVDVANAFDDFDREEIYDFAKLRFNVLQALFRGGHCEGLPTMYTHRFEEQGVSFADIIDVSSNDTEALGTLILSYLKSLPKGDYVWEKFKELFVFPGTYNSQDEAYGQAQQDVAWKLFLFQKWLGEKLFLPHLIEDVGTQLLPEHVLSFQSVDRSLDKHFAQALSRLQPTQAHILGLTVFGSLAHAVSILRGFHSEMAEEEAIGYSPIVHLATAYHLNQGGSSMIIADRTIHYLFQLHWGGLREKASTRLWGVWAARSNTARFLDGFSTNALKNYDKELTAELLKLIRENLGEHYLARMGEITPQLGEVNARLLQELAEIDYWPHPAISHTLRFPDRTLPHILGFESISMKFGESARAPIGFRFVFEGSHIGLSGEVYPQTYTCRWDIDESIFDPDLLSVITTIVLASLRDYVKRGDLVIREQKDPESQEEGDGAGASEVDADTEGEGVVYERPAPRKSFRYIGRASGEPEEEVVDAGELVEAIEEEQELAGLVVRHIDSHRRTYVSDEQVLAYAGATRELTNAPPHEYAAAYEKAVEIRSQFRQPSEPKREAMSGLPPKLQLRPLLDPDSGGYLTDILSGREGWPLYRDTFVVAYTRPALTEEEMFSLPVRYERRYVAAEGSAIAFLDELIPLMLGEERGEQEQDDA